MTNIHLDTMVLQNARDSRKAITKLLLAAWIVGSKSPWEKWITLLTVDIKLIHKLELIDVNFSATAARNR